MSLNRVKLFGLACCLVFMIYRVESLQLCGSALPEMLERICVNGFNSKMKRNYVMPDYDDVEDNGSNLANYGAYSRLESRPLLRAMIGESANHLVNTRRRRFGITDECCSQSCSLKELYEYCI